MVAGRRFVRHAAAVLVIAIALGLQACRDEPTGAITPFSIEPSLATDDDVVVGTVVTPSPTFVVRNAAGDALANVPVSVIITRGNGTLSEAPARTSSGATAIGQWTIDTLAVVNEVTIVAGSAPPVRISLRGVAGPPASVSADANALHGFAGDFLNSLFALRVRDRYGNPVAGAGVQLTVSKGGGDVSPQTVLTDANGIASGIAWRLGRLGGEQRLVASVGPLSAEIDASIRSGFRPVIRPHGAIPQTLLNALTTAADRLQASIIGDVSDVPVLNFDMSRCGMQGITLNETVDDLVIFALVTPIDGVGRVLASAGPCVLRTQSRFPVIGVMRFDADDLDALASNGRLGAVALHEMLHVIGIGTLWRAKDLVVGSGTQDPRFIGPRAAAECLAAGGFHVCGDGRVPVENSGGSGTVDVHWRESAFDREVMTGFVESSGDMPLSGITLASLEDLGYAINLLSADPFQVPPPAPVSPRISPRAIAPWESVTIPLYEVTPGGEIRVIVK